jgi:hypothetical protein
MRVRGLAREGLMDGDADAKHNRRVILGEVRGFGRNNLLFGGFPGDTSWRRVLVELPDFDRLKYINRDAGWLGLSRGTRLVRDGAHYLDSNQHIREKVLGARREIEQNRCTAELILVEADDGALVVVEGHTRATAYIVLGRPFLALVGKSPSMSTWHFI